MIKGDHLAYRRAALVSALGLMIQTVLAVVMLVYARLTGDHSAMTAVFLLGSGILVWGTLLLLFDQHRRERIEALEAEQLAASGGTSTAFETINDDLRANARRLAFTQRWVVPFVGIVIASINLSAGILRFRDWSNEANPESGVTPGSGLSLSLGLAVAIVLFVFARFVSGMGTLKPWANLRAGAAQAVAVSLVGLLIAASAFFELALSQDWLSLVAPYAVAVLLIVLGSEIVLHLVFDLYRPRQVGDDPRPAFDSRLLGLVAAPDRIAESVGDAVNYQFGVDISGSWFYQLLSRWVLGLLAMGVAIAWLLTSVVVIQPHQRGMVLTFGNIGSPLVSFGDRGESGDLGPGLHLKWPWPVSTFEIPTIGDGRDEDQYASAGVRVLQLSSAPPDDRTRPILWGQDHAAREFLNIVQPGLDTTITSDARNTGPATTATGLSLLAIEIPVHYIVRDVKLFDEFAAPAYRERLLTSIGRRVVTQFVGQMSIDEILATKRTELSVRLEALLDEAFDALNNGRGVGIDILFVGAHGVHPPVKVAPNFERVIQARQNREALIEQALKTKTTRLTEAAGSVDLADEIVSLLFALDRVRGSGTDEEIELELQVQRLLEQTGGEAGELLLSAGAQRWNRHMSERGQAALLLGQVAAFEAAPELFRASMYLDALLAVMAESRVYVTPESLESLHIRLELQDRAAGRDVLDETAGAELAQ